MRYGTSHFISRPAAERYYAPYGYDDIKAAITRKIADGEIHIGEPTLKEGDKLLVNQDEGRYFIETKEA